MKTDSIFILMGVSGSGKTTVGQMLARATRAAFLDADNFHTPENKAQMHAGIPLTDEERWPWLDRLNTELQIAATKDGLLFLACSALKQSHRDRLVAGISTARFVYLQASFELIQSRLAQRKNHFMSPNLLQSQFATLEVPRDAIVLDVSGDEKQLLGDFLSLAQISPNDS